MTGKILIVEDDPDIARLVGLKLKQQRLEPVFAADAVTAVTIALFFPKPLDLDGLAGAIRAQLEPAE